MICSPCETILGVLVELEHEVESGDCWMECSHCGECEACDKSCREPEQYEPDYTQDSTPYLE